MYPMKIIMLAAGALVLGGGAVHMAEPLKPRTVYVKHAKYVPHRLRKTVRVAKKPVLCQDTSFKKKTVDTRDIIANSNASTVPNQNINAAGGNAIINATGSISGNNVSGGFFGTGVIGLPGGSNVTVNVTSSSSSSTSSSTSTSSSSSSTSGGVMSNSSSSGGNSSGSNTTGSSGSTPVPEPGMLVLFALSCGIIFSLKPIKLWN